MRRKRTLTEKRTAAGRKGGAATLERYGAAHYSNLTTLRVNPGRPRLKTLEEIKTESTVVIEIGEVPTNLRELKRLWHRKQRGELLVFAVPGSPEEVAGEK